MRVAETVCRTGPVQSVPMMSSLVPSLGEKRLTIIWSGEMLPKTSLPHTVPVKAAIPIAARTTHVIFRAIRFFFDSSSCLKINIPSRMPAKRTNINPHARIIMK